MPDRTAPRAPTATEAELAVARIEAMSADLRGCVVLDPNGRALAASGDPERWAGAGRELLAAADRAIGERATYAHVGTEDGEAFAVRHEGYALVAACNRFALASLMIFDMRSILRELVQGVAPAAVGQAVAR